MPQRQQRQWPTIEARLVDRIVGGVRAGKYHLVLGAGASSGVTSSRGPLPMAPALTELLLAELDIGAPAGTTVSLQRAFSRAVSTRGKAAIEELLRSYFAYCTPAPWQQICPLIPWQAIWTLNIDDSIEYAYQGQAARAQRAVVKVWQDRPAPFGGLTDEVPVVHLHGYVGSIDSREECELVFSLQQYLSALRQSDLGNWQTRFRGDYQSSPMIVIGARMQDELDLASVIEAGNVSKEYGLPSLIVRPNISAFEADEYREWGLEPVSATAEQFMVLLRDAIERTATTLEGQPYSNRYTDATFVNLTPRRSDHSPSAGHDFYGGHEPEWIDILNNLDAVPGWIAELVDDIGDPASRRDSRTLYYLYGSAFSGKSTALLRLARALLRNGWQVFHLSGQERLDVDEGVRFFADRRSACLLVDDLRFDVSDIAALLTRAEQQKIRLLIVAADRSRSMVHAARVIPKRFLIGAESRIFIEPTPQLWQSIIARRSKAGRLGQLEGQSRRSIALHFVQHEADLYSSLASLEDAAGFIDRGLAVVDSVSPDLRPAFAAVGLCAAVGLSAPVTGVAACSGVSIHRLVEACAPGGELYGWLTTDSPGLVSMRHHYLGELLLQEHVPQRYGINLAVLMRDLLIAVSDRVGREGMFRRDYYYRIASQLMDVAFVQRIVGQDGVDAWYEALVEHYGWNARFWEQRALGLPDELDKAFSYARRAVQRHRDAFTLNTLGTILMRRAAHASTSAAARLRYWREGNEALIAARTDGRGRYELPFLTFFGQTIRVMEQVPARSPRWDSEIREAVGAWIREAQNERVAHDFGMDALISRFPPEWRGNWSVRASQPGRRPRKAAPPPRVE